LEKRSKLREMINGLFVPVRLNIPMGLASSAVVAALVFLVVYNVQIEKGFDVMNKDYSKGFVAANKQEQNKKIAKTKLLPAEKNKTENSILDQERLKKNKTSIPLSSIEPKKELKSAFLEEGKKEADAGAALSMEMLDAFEIKAYIEKAGGTVISFEKIFGTVIYPKQIEADIPVARWADCLNKAKSFRSVKSILEEESPSIGVRRVLIEFQPRNDASLNSLPE